MRKRALAGVVLALLAPRPAAADLVACAVRLRDGIAVAAWSAPARSIRPLLASPTGVSCKASHPLGSWIVVGFDDPAACAAAMTRFASDPRVAACEPIRTFTVCATDARLLAGEIPSNVQQVRAPEALGRIVPDSTIVVAVIDTGADLTHPDLVRRLWRNDDAAGNADFADDHVDQNLDGRIDDWERDDDDDNGYVDDVHGFDFTDAPGRGGVGDALEPDADPSDEHGHGTHVAGIIAADGTLQGVAPFVQLMPVRAAYTTAFGGGVLETDDAAAAIVYAVDNGARVLNLSWGDRDDSQLVREALAYAAAHDVVVVAAAGNGATDAPHYPSSDPQVIAVSAVDGTGVRSSFSNYGAGITLAAPGERFAGVGGGIVSLAPGGGRAERRGTSMAAPHVAGIAAIVLSRADQPNAAAVRAALVAGAQRDAARIWSPEVGHGVVDGLGALDAVAPLFVAVTGPQHAFQRGRLTLLGTIVGGDLARWRLDVRRLTESNPLPVVEWRGDAVVADTLVSIALSDAMEGEWEYTLRAETGAGEAAEHHAPFQVDVTAPRLDTLAVASGWRGAESRVFITLESDDAIGVGLTSGADTVRAGEAGFGRRIELEVDPAGWSENPLTLRCTNAADLARDTTFAPPASRSPWPRGGRLQEQVVIAGFFADPVWGTSRSGARVVWGRGGSGATLHVQGWIYAAGSPVLWHDTGSDGIPIGYADVSGDGAADLVVRRGRDTIEWWGATAASEFPDSLLGTARAERALGVFQLDADAAYETLLSSRDSLFVYDDARAGSPPRVQALRNPAPSGFATWGADAAAGDLDGDGAIEIACGDAAGFLAVFERDAAGVFQPAWTAHSGGVYAYDFTALPEGGFLVGRQRSENPAGDGFSTALYDFIRYAPDTNGYVQTDAWPFLAPANDLGAGSSAVASPATGAAWLALVRGEDLYLLRGLGAARTQEVQIRDAARRAPALLDWDADGSLDLLLRSDAGTTFLRLEEGERGPHDLVATSLGASRLRLDWVPSPGTSSRLRRASADSWTNLGETTGSSWVDSTLTSGVLYAYEVVAIAAGMPRGVSNRIAARAQSRPRLLAASPQGDRSVRVALSQPLHPHGATDRWRARDAAGRVLRVVHVVRAAGGRDVTLVFDAAPSCGPTTVIADQVRDDQNGLLEPPVDSTLVTFACDTAAFAVQSVAFAGRDIDVRFTTPPGPLAFEPGRYALRWDAALLPIVAVRALDATRLRLEPAPEVRFVGRGVSYRLQLDAAIRSAAGATLAFPEIEYVLRVEGRGALQVFPWPNPAGPADAAIVFADAAADTRITIYDLEGERVRTLDGALGGGIPWDLRDEDGGIVPSGVYFFVARDATGSQSGRVALRR